MSWEAVIYIDVWFALLAGSCDCSLLPPPPPRSRVPWPLEEALPSFGLLLSVSVLAPGEDLLTVRMEGFFRAQENLVGLYENQVTKGVFSMKCSSLREVCSPSDLTCDVKNKYINKSASAS